MVKKNLLNANSVVLVSGGGRGITAQCVIRLAERSKSRFILLGRTALDGALPAWAETSSDEMEMKRRIMEDMTARGEKPLPAKIQKTYKNIVARKEIRETIAAVNQAGGYAEYISVDIADQQAVQEKLAEPIFRLGPVTGIIHGAGNLADKLIEKKTVQDFETVYSPKVDGLQTLLAVAPAKQLDFIVLFSSIVGFFGNIGQTDYAIANEILNKSAHLLKLKNPNCHVVSINWGPWEAGMVTPELKRAFEERGVEIIPVETGARMLLQELLPQESQSQTFGGRAVQVVVGTPPAMPTEADSSALKQYQIRRKLTLEANPFLYDHRIGEKAVLPATCAATWAVHSVEQMYPGYFFHYMSNFRVLKGIVFDETLAGEYVMDIKEIAKSPQGIIDFKALIWSKNARGRTLYHYTIEVRLGKTVPPAPLLPLEDLSEKELISGKELYENGTLFHGPAFQGVRRVLKVNKGELKMECVLPAVAAKVQGQFPVITGNPFLYDAVVQGVLIWAQYMYQAPCLPSRVDMFEQFKAIPFDTAVIVDMQVVSQSETSVVTNVTVQDQTGAVCVRITNLEGTISPQLNRLIGAKSALPVIG
jgi:NAD(P)-dependent dehydrogenase (short-subunit alcohol dehydrogenase family)